jgi:hypothetical protein
MEIQVLDYNASSNQKVTSGSGPAIVWVVCRVMLTGTLASVDETPQYMLLVRTLSLCSIIRT